MASALLLIIVFILDLIAFALAVAAEQRKSKGTEQIDKSGSGPRYYCAYSSDIATGLGVGSFLFLLAAQLLIMVASRCLCCGRGLRPGGSRACAIILFITCWVAFFIAEVLLLAGSARNVYHTKYTSDQQISCQTLRKGVFGAAAAFIVFTGILSELYYVSYSKANSDLIPPYRGDTGVRMSTM